jgi:hypothetical protein
MGYEYEWKCGYKYEMLIYRRTEKKIEKCQRNNMRINRAWD